ncbi:MAG: hypothetical protein IJ600_00865 [Lachnospiraceae bacterium]|nr:hypothetical protein [Lachnospiraceae bacterium]
MPKPNIKQVMIQDLTQKKAQLDRVEAARKGIFASAGQDRVACPLTLWLLAEKGWSVEEITEFTEKGTCPKLQDDNAKEALVREFYERMEALKIYKEAGEGELEPDAEAKGKILGNWIKEGMKKLGMAFRMPPVEELDTPEKAMRFLNSRPVTDVLNLAQNFSQELDALFDIPGVGNTIRAEAGADALKQLYTLQCVSLPMSVFQMMSKSRKGTAYVGKDAVEFLQKIAGKGIDELDGVEAGTYGALLNGAQGYVAYPIGTDENNNDPKYTEYLKTGQFPDGSTEIKVIPSGEQQPRTLKQVVEDKKPLLAPGIVEFFTPPEKVFYENSVSGEQMQEYLKALPEDLTYTPDVPEEAADAVHRLYVNTAKTIASNYHYVILAKLDRKVEDIIEIDGKPLPQIVDEKYAGQNLSAQQRQTAMEFEFARAFTDKTVKLAYRVPEIDPVTLQARLSAQPKPLPQHVAGEKAFDKNSDIVPNFTNNIISSMMGCVLTIKDVLPQGMGEKIHEQISHLFALCTAATPTAPREKAMLATSQYSVMPEELRRNAKAALLQIHDLAEKCQGMKECQAQDAPITALNLRYLEQMTRHILEGVAPDIDLVRLMPAEYTGILCMSDLVTYQPAEGLSEEQKKQERLAFEAKAKDSAYIAMINSALDQFEKGAEYQKLLRAGDGNAAAEEKKKLLQQIDAGNTTFIGKADNLMELVGKQDFRVEDHVEINSNTIANMRLERGMPSLYKRQKITRALRELKELPEDMEADGCLYAMVAARQRLRNKDVDPEEYPSLRKLSGWINRIEAATDPDLIRWTVEDLTRKGISYHAYIKALRNGFRKLVAEANADASIPAEVKHAWGDILNFAGDLAVDPLTCIDTAPGYLHISEADLKKAERELQNREEQIDTAFGELSELESFWHFHSTEYKELMGRLKDLNATIRKYNEKPVDAKGLDRLKEESTRALQAADAYIAMVDGKVQAGAERTEKERKRLEIVKKLRDIIAKDREGILSYDTAAGKTAPEMLDDARTVVSDVRAQEISYVGGEVNRRMVMTDARGKKGVFTETTRLGTPEEYWDQLRQLHPQRVELIDALQADLMIPQYLPGSWEALFNGWPDTRGELQGRLNGVAVQFNLEDKATRDFLKTALEGAAQENVRRDVYAVAKVDSGRNLDKRNVAMSSLAGRLGVPGVVAGASLATVRGKDGRLKQGTFMEWAEGEVIASGVPDDNSKFLKKGVRFYTPSLLRSMADLQVVYYLAGNVDGHFGNLSFVFGEDENGNPRVTSVVGIDHDSAFGKVKGEPGEVSRLLPRPDKGMLVMRKEMADMVLRLTKEELTYSLTGLIEPDEIDAAWERTETLKRQIRADMKKEWAASDSLEKGHLHILEDNDGAWERFDPQTLGPELGTTNIFAQYNKLVKSVKEQRRTRVEEGPDRQAEKWEDVRRQLFPESETDIAHAGCFEPGEGVKIRMPHDMQPNAILGLYRSRNSLADDQARVELGSSLFMSVIDQVSGMTQRQHPDVLPAGREEKINQLTGLKRFSDMCYIDGIPAREFISRYGVEQNADEKLVQAHIAAALTSGRHAVDVVKLRVDADGRAVVDIRALEPDLAPLNERRWFGKERAERSEALQADIRERGRRFEKIRTALETRANSLIADAVADEIAKKGLGWMITDHAGDEFRPAGQNNGAVVPEVPPQNGPEPEVPPQNGLQPQVPPQEDVLHKAKEAIRPDAPDAHAVRRSLSIADMDAPDAHAVRRSFSIADVDMEEKTAGRKTEHHGRIQKNAPAEPVQPGPQRQKGGKA